MSQENETRKLTLEEVYQDIYRQYKKALVRIGQLKSFIDEKEDEIKQLTHENKKLSEIDQATGEVIKAELKKTQYIKNLLEKNENLEKNIMALKNTNQQLVIKIVQYEKAKQSAG